MTNPSFNSSSISGHPPQASQQRMACLWLPNWPIQRLVAVEPELRCQRLVLFRRDSRRGRLVSAASPLAQRAGIRVGMPISRAEMGDCYLREHDSTVDRQALEELTERLNEFSPMVGLESADEKSSRSSSRSSRHSIGHLSGRSSTRSGASPDTTMDWKPSSILFDLTGISRLFGGEENLARQLFERIQQLGYVPRLAIADTIGVAWGVSHFGTTGWSVIPPADHQAWSGLPLDALRLSAATVDTLQQLGLQRIDQLLLLPRDQLAMRFGDEIHRRLDQALGARPETFQAHRSTIDFSATQALEYPLTHRETIEITIGRMVQDICQQLRSRQQAGQQWCIHLVGTEQDPLRISVGLFRATTNPQELMPLIQMQLDHQLQQSNRSGRSRLPLAVEEIQVRATSVVLMVRYQRQLFDDPPGMDQQSLADLVNRLSNRLGQQKVLAARLRSGAQPEYAFEYRPLIDRKRRSHKRAIRSSTSVTHVAGRPLRILTPAFPINVVPNQRTSNCAMQACPLQTFRTEKQTFQVVQGWGPERIETGWWRGLMVVREYWRIEVASGQQFWLYQNLRDQSWFLQGEF